MDWGSDVSFSATLSGSAGHVRVVDAGGLVVDKVAWGTTAVSPETASALVAPSGSVLERRTIYEAQLQDTDDNSVDIWVAPPKDIYTYGALYEVQDLCSNIDGIQVEPPEGYEIQPNGQCNPPPVDVCTNIDGLQTSLQPGYVFDDAGLCQFDACSNVDGIQTYIPADMDSDGQGGCIDKDVCLNLPGIQPVIPAGFEDDLVGNCVLGLLPLQITELLANPEGDDHDNEYIELYNPNSVAIELTYYMLYVGSSSSTFYSFPAGTIIQPESYAVLYSSQSNFTLVNSTSSVSLRVIDNSFVDQTDAYSNPPSGMAWALIDGLWQYTDRPTPGAANLAMTTTVDDVEEVVVGLKPCAANQYRNPETNRCRLLVKASAALVPCKDGQYRSEETNRCRSIVADVTSLSPCAENQERNPITNRCRLIANNVSDLVPCGEGQERNPDTNRCRNSTATSVPEASFAVEFINETFAESMGWWVAIGVAILATTYAVWEWRAEIKDVLKKLKSFLQMHK